MAKRLQRSWNREGWGKLVPREYNEFYRDAEAIQEVAESFPVGTVLGVRRYKFSRRLAK